MTERLNKQGVRNLDPPGTNGRKTRKHCRHFYGPLVVVGHRWTSDDYFSVYQEPIFDRVCIHCGKEQGYRW